METVWMCPICEKRYPLERGAYRDECPDCTGNTIKFMFAPTTPIFAWYLQDNDKLMSAPIIYISYTEADGVEMHDLAVDGYDDGSPSSESINFVAYLPGGERPTASMIKETKTRVARALAKRQAKKPEA